MTFASSHLPPTEGAEVIVHVAVAAAAIEGVPEWVKYVAGLAGTLIIAPFVGVLVQALRRRLGVPDDTSSTPDTPTPGRHSAGQAMLIATAPSTPDEDERELEELRLALADVLVELRQTRAQAAAAEQRAAKAEQRAERLQGLLETLTERLHPNPPSP